MSVVSGVLNMLDSGILTYLPIQLGHKDEGLQVLVIYKSLASLPPSVIIGFEFSTWM